MTVLGITLDKPETQNWFEQIQQYIPIAQNAQKELNNE